MFVVTIKMSWHSNVTQTVSIDKVIYINEKNINNEKNRKYKYGNKNFDELIDLLDNLKCLDLNQIKV